MSWGRPNDPMESEQATWRCQDCLTFWAGDPESWGCSVAGCEVLVCSDCRTVCYSCGEIICSNHREKRQYGDGLKFYCPNCVIAGEQRKAQESEAAA